jgi:hypothetical protein
MTAAELIVVGSAAYLLVGLAFGAYFVSAGVVRFDPAARGTSTAFRALILPGSVALWPILAVKWIHRTRERP